MNRIRQRIGRLAWIIRVLVSSGFLALLRPDRYVRMGLSLRRQGGANAVTGIGLAAAQYPGAVALHDDAGSLTWAQLDARVDALAVGLTELTARPPQTVAIMCRNHRVLVEALAATIRIGADAVLLNTGFAGPQLADVLKREKADILIADDEFAGLVAQARETNSTMRCVWAWQEGKGLQADPDTTEHVIASRLGRRPARPRKPGRVILLTSGTTGTPKGAKRATSGSDVTSLVAMLDRIPWQGGETMVIAAPIFHAWGFGQMAIAATMHVTMVMTRRFDPENTLDLVRDHRATGLAVVPVMLERIMDLPAATLAAKPMPTLRFATASGSRMRADSLIAFMDHFGDVVYNSYNATEAGLISTAVPADLRHAPDTAGRPIAGTTVRVLDEQLDPVPTGEIGKIAVANDSAFDGYTSDDTKDYADGYMLSGDLGRFDSDGLLYVVGRDDEMIVSGGENVYPLEVEQVLDAYPGVADAAVIGVDDERFGQRLAAYVVRSNPAVDADTLKEHIKGQLAGYKVPRDIHFIEVLPRNATGKVLKRNLSEKETDPMLQRLSGNDALMLNMENPTTPMHTLKVAILDSSRRGSPVTLDELRAVLPRYLGNFPRANQRVETASQTYSARPFWVPDPDFDIAAHLDERSVDEPGDRVALDRVLSVLAVEQLDRRRPLWALTLVNGLADGQQAVVVRVHHAVADGLAALNMFMTATSEEGGTITAAPIPDVDPVTREELLRTARAESKRLFRNVPRATGRLVRGMITSRRFENRHLVPMPMESARNSFSTRSGGERRCASASLPLKDFQQIAVAAGTTVNGALHGVIAGAKRAEMIARSEDLRSPAVTVFGVAADMASNRTAGNEISTALAYLRTDIDDPVERLTATAQSCAAAVSKRRTIGFELTDQIAVYTGRTGPVFRKLAAPVTPRVVNNITTANLPGPRQTRWVGDIEVVDWISFALAIAPADVNLTAYSYAGRISMGLITTPESMPDPERFLRRVEESLEQVRSALIARGLLDPEATREPATEPPKKAK